MECFRNAESVDSAVNNRALDSGSPYENVTDAFHDLYDAIDKLETDSSAAKVLVSGPSLGDLLQINIT